MSKPLSALPPTSTEEEMPCCFCDGKFTPEHDAAKMMKMCPDCVTKTMAMTNEDSPPSSPSTSCYGDNGDCIGGGFSPSSEVEEQAPRIGNVSSPINSCANVS